MHARRRHRCRTRQAGADPAPSFSPLYQQIKALLMRSLQAGEWKPGDMIPSEMDLAARFKVSQGTVRKAIDELAAENHLVRRQGKGTFVATHAEEQTQYRFLRLMPDDGAPQAACSAACSSAGACAPRPRWRAARPEVGRGGGAGAAPAAGRRRRCGAGRHLAARPAVQGPDGRAPGRLARADVRPVRDRVRRAHGPRRGAHPRRGRQRRRRRLLSVPVGAPLLSVERLSFTYGDKPVELRRGLYDTSPTTTATSSTELLPAQPRATVLRKPVALQ
jgi:GntR family transcriptional regulator